MTVGIVSLILTLLIVIYLMYFACGRRRLSQFTWLTLTTMVIIESVSTFNLMSYHYTALENCFLEFRIMIAATFLMTKIMGLVLAFRYYQTMNEIYKFSLEGILPSEQVKKRRSCMLIILAVTMAIFFLAYILLYFTFSVNHNMRKLLLVTRC